jgi:hypothetical protein
MGTVYRQAPRPYLYRDNSQHGLDLCRGFIHVGRPPFSGTVAVWNARVRNGKSVFDPYERKVNARNLLAVMSPLLTIIIATLTAVLGSGVTLEAFRRWTARKDKRLAGTSEIVVRQIDDRADQRGEWWSEIERLRVRLDKMENRQQKTQAYCYEIWAYSMRVRELFQRVAVQLRNLGHEVPDLPPEPPPLDKVFGDVHKSASTEDPQDAR